GPPRRAGVLAGPGQLLPGRARLRAGAGPTTPGRGPTQGPWSARGGDLSGLLGDGVAEGYIITTPPEHRTTPDAHPVPRSESLYVCYRTGDPCRVCSSPIAATELAGRNLYWCPGCQPHS